jgi:ornithine carbamoyltransferase
MQHFLKIADFQKSELCEILELSRTLHMIHGESLRQKNILFCFEKPSLRTKVGTEVAINQLGGRVIHISPLEFLGGKIMYAKPVAGYDERESLKDTVKNVSRWCDAVFVRVFKHETLETLVRYADIPVVNALSDLHHPMQSLADFYTIQSRYGESKELTITFVGDENLI